MKSEAEIEDALSKFEQALSLRLDQIESLDEQDRLYLVKRAKIARDIKELEAKIGWCKWALK